MIYTTLNEIRHFGPCEPMWTKLLTHLGKTKTDDEPLPLVTVLDSNGLYDTLWCLRVCPDVAVEFARWCANEAAKAADEADEAAAKAAATKVTADADYWTAAAKAFWAAKSAADADWADWAANGGADRQIAKLRELLS